MIDEYSYGHLMILEISSDQQKRPAGLIKRETGVFHSGSGCVRSVCISGDRNAGGWWSEF